MVRAAVASKSSAKRNQVNVNLEDEEFEQIAKMAKEQERSMAYIVRQFLLTAMKQATKGDRGSATPPKKG